MMHSNLLIYFFIIQNLKESINYEIVHGLSSSMKYILCNVSAYLKVVLIKKPIIPQWSHFKYFSLDMSICGIAYEYGWEVAASHIDPTYTSV